MLEQNSDIWPTIIQYTSYEMLIHVQLDCNAFTRTLLFSRVGDGDGLRSFILKPGHIYHDQHIAGPRLGGRHCCGEQVVVRVEQGVACPGIANTLYARIMFITPRQYVHYHLG